MDLTQATALHVSPEQAEALPNDPGHPSVRVMAHGSMELRWYRVHGERHAPHDRDEVYFVVRGTADFFCSNEPGPFVEGKVGLAGARRSAVAAGDVVFVPAGAEHYFEAMSGDFAIWAMFYGPEGGEGDGR